MISSSASAPAASSRCVIISPLELEEGANIFQSAASRAAARESTQVPGGSGPRRAVRKAPSGSLLRERNASARLMAKITLPGPSRHAPAAWRQFGPSRRSSGSQPAPSPTTSSRSGRPNPQVDSRHGRKQAQVTQRPARRGRQRASPRAPLSSFRQLTPVPLAPPPAHTARLSQRPGPKRFNLFIPVASSTGAQSPPPPTPPATSFQATTRLSLTDRRDERRAPT